MKLLIALAFVALTAAAAPDAIPIEILTPTPVKVIDGPAPNVIAVSSETQVPTTGRASVNPTTIEKITPVNVAAPVITKAADVISPVKVVDAPVESKVADVISPVKVVDAPEESRVADVISPVKVADAPEESRVANVISPVKVVDAPVESKVADVISPVKVADGDQIFQMPAMEVVLDDPEAMQKLYKDVRGLADISPAYVSREVMLQADTGSDVINVGGANPFSFNNAEPLDNVDPVKIVDEPLDELNYKMDPVLLVEGQAEALLSEGLKVVDNVEFQGPVKGIVPREMWRGPEPMTQEQKMLDNTDYQKPVKGIVPMQMWRGPVPTEEEQTMVDHINIQEPIKGIVPREMWRGPGPMKPEQGIENVHIQEPVKGIVPREMWRGPTPMDKVQIPPKPTYWRDLPQVPSEHGSTHFRDLILRNNPEYRMPPAAYRDPALR